MKAMKMTFFAWMILALTVSLTACQATAGSANTSQPEAAKNTLLTKPVIIGQPDAGRTISLKTGDTLLIELDGNITTGFNWIPAPQYPALLSQVGDNQVTPESNLPGAPGRIVLQFKAVAQGQTLLHLDYRRSWETGVAPEKTFEVTVVVK
jgi:inhibitor of cysteine peptidase